MRQRTIRLIDRQPTLPGQRMQLAALLRRQSRIFLQHPLGILNNLPKFHHSLIEFALADELVRLPGLCFDRRKIWERRAGLALRFIGCCWLSRLLCDWR